MTRSLMTPTFDIGGCLSIMAAVPEHEQAYFLVDNSAIDGAWYQSLEPSTAMTYSPLIHWLNTQSMTWTTLIGQTDIPRDTAFTPVLFAVNTEQVRRFHHFTQDNAELNTAVSLLISDQPWATLQQRLKKRIPVEIGGDTFVLRYFDTRLWHEWCQLLTPEQRDLFLSAAGTWWVPDRNGQWLPYAAQTPVDDPVSTSTSLITLTEQQQAAVSWLGQADRVGLELDMYWQEGWKPESTPQQKYQWLSEQIKAAQTWGLESIEEQTLYSTLALRQGDDFARTEVWQKHLQQVQKKERSLQQILESDVTL